MGVSVGVGGDDVADPTSRGEDAELAAGLVAAQQDREGVTEERRVLSLSLAEEVGRRLASQQSRPVGRDASATHSKLMPVSSLRSLFDVKHLVSRASARDNASRLGTQTWGERAFGTLSSRLGTANVGFGGKKIA